MAGGALNKEEKGVRLRSKCFAHLIGTIGATLAVSLFAAGAATAAPLVINLGHASKQVPNEAYCEANFGFACYQPYQIQQAYDMNPLYRAGLTGRGKTIVLVDSYGSPTIQSDLATFDKTFGLPAPPSFRIITPAGTPPPYDQTNFDMGGWSFETTLDVEYAHAMAPGANILEVETPVDETIGVQGFPQMIEAENYVIDHHLGDVISQSFAAAEQTFPNAGSIYGLRSAYFNALVHHVTVLGATGDLGASSQSAYDTSDGEANYFTSAVINWPAGDPLVTAVGGTQLRLDVNGNRTAPDSVWNDTAAFDSPLAGGGGVSSVFARPFYENGVAGVVGRARGIPDLAMSAACTGSVVIYDSVVNTAYGLSGPNYYTVCGTSEASPLFAGIVAVADQAAHRDLGWLNPILYGLGDGPRSGIVDVTTGNNSVSGTQQLPPLTGDPFSVTGYNAGSGYDLASGLGTADGARLVGALAGYRSFSRHH
jgi:subtilase family serine protease